MRLGIVAPRIGAVAQIAPDGEQVGNQFEGVFDGLWTWLSSV